MKRNILVFALIAIFALSLTSCGKKEKTNTELITTAKGWVMKSATVTPAVPVGEGTTTNWYDEYLYEYEQDDIIVFNANGSFVIKPGKNVPGDTEDGYVEEKASTWAFNSDETKVKMQIPFFYDIPTEGPARTFNAQFEEPEISKLTETEMVLIYKANTVFAKGVDYTWTLTYEPVK
jgi:hypothetical protein